LYHHYTDVKHSCSLVVFVLSLLCSSCNWFSCWADTTGGTIGGNKICSLFRSFRNRHSH